MASRMAVIGTLRRLKHSNDRGFTQFFEKVRSLLIPVVSRCPNHAGALSVRSTRARPCGYPEEPGGRHPAVQHDHGRKNCPKDPAMIGTTPTRMNAGR